VTYKSLYTKNDSELRMCQPQFQWRFYIIYILLFLLVIYFIFLLLAACLALRPPGSQDHPVGIYQPSWGFYSKIQETGILTQNQFLAKSILSCFIEIQKPITILHIIRNEHLIFSLEDRIFKVLS